MPPTKAPKIAKAFRKRVTSKTVTLKGCVTIDSSKTDDQHYLSAAHDFLKASTSINPGAHSTRLIAATNLLGCQSSAGSAVTSELNVVGHGHVGMIITGSGSDDPPSTLQFVGNDNHADWIHQQELLKLGKHSNVITLLSCDTGAGADGRNFLRDLANATGATVKAPTGLIFCDDGGFFIGSHTHWQVATPSLVPQPIPLSVEYVINPQMSVIQIWEGDHLTVVPLAAVERLTLVTRSLNHPRTLGAQATVDGDQARDAVKAIQFDEAIIDLPSVAATLTGELTIVFSSGVKEGVRRFRILNERLLQDAAAPHVFYFADRDRLRALVDQKHLRP